MVRITEQSEINFSFGFETGEHLFRVRAHAQNHCVLLIKPLLCVTKLGRFDDSTSGVSFRIEKQDDAFAAKVLQGNRFPFARFQSK